MERGTEAIFSCSRKTLTRLFKLWHPWLLMLLMISGNAHAAGSSYTITATAGTGGTISPSGAVSVKSGNNQAFTIAANTGYNISNVVVDGISQGAISSYTFTNVRATHTISATFAITTYTISASAESGGSISPSGSVQVNYAGNQTFTITPNTGYSVTNVTVDGVSQGAVTTYSFTNVQAAHSISATFAITTYPINVTAGAGGYITPSSAIVTRGGSQSFAITPNAGYYIAGVTVDGVAQGAITSYSFTNVSASHSIEATFTLTTFGISAMAGPGGTITPLSGPVNYGANQTYTITPNAGYSTANVTVDGVPQWGITSYTFTNVTSSHTITAIFTTSTPPLSSSSSSYFYDDAGRLTQEVQGPAGMRYNYDELGNVTSVRSTTISGDALSLSGIVPNVFWIGARTSAVISGQNLLTTDAVATVAGLVEIDGMSVVDNTKIVVNLTARSTGTGTETIRVTNRGGSSSSINVRLLPGPDAANKIQQDLNFTYSYDDNGNLVQKTSSTTGQVTTYGYDDENRLVLVNYPGTTVTYKYDAFGRRIEKSSNGAVSSYLYDELGILVEYDGNTQILGKYTHGLNIDEPLSVQKNGQEYYYHASDLGSISALSDSNGNIVQRYKYDSFGNILSILDPALTQPFAYTGREWDKETGLYYYRARYYDPAQGRFNSKNPAVFKGGMNPYIYVGQNPINYVDPLGCDPVTTSWQPSWYPGSSFGHTSTNASDTTYLFGSQGIPILPRSKGYLDQVRIPDNLPKPR